MTHGTIFIFSVDGACDKNFIKTKSTKKNTSILCDEIAFFCTKTLIFISTFTWFLTGVTVNVPAGLWGEKKQLTKEEALYTRKVSSLRVHIERMNG